MESCIYINFVCTKQQVFQALLSFKSIEPKLNNIEQRQESLKIEFINIAKDQKLKKFVQINGFDKMVEFTWYDKLVETGKLDHELDKFIRNSISHESNIFYCKSTLEQNNNSHIRLHVSDEFISTSEFNLCYPILRELFDVSMGFDGQIWFYLNNRKTIIDGAYLEALRIKEENRGIKLNKEQGHVLSCVEGQCRWFYIPTGDTEVIIKQLGLLKEIQEADITTIIDEVQNENKIAMATFLEDTIIFGMNVPYIQYPNLDAYKLIKGSSTPVLQNTLNALSKTFGFAAYYEYNNDDELIASLAFSKKGKFTYGHFSSEGQGVDIFGSQKKPMEVNQKSILKSAKKQGITPEEMLVNLMKQKQKVKYFTQCNWMIEDMLSM